ncbi:MAG: trypsin-like peptidase domain-containing protein [Leptolyngbyaceae cyanobacterium MO_188.B28]|nr:trypsin-like peptidase domain-containing protein [Leptolyngbyaceae cyanobacterium MO_188.B28]
MAAQLRINRDDYEQSIARILNAEGCVIGTGFLVAPGYVLTCAHVVLQAIGIDKEDFTACKGQPEEVISLEFHILKPRDKIKAKVVAWLPYSVSDGDVAGLKLLSKEPEGTKSIPLSQVSLSEIQIDQHSVYGFGKSKDGGRSDAYKPKANVAGGRYQFCKVGNPDDETIKPGFSGAPVWNEERECVIGMVATAIVTNKEQKSTAYAIPTKELQPVLQQLSANHLIDLLEQSLYQSDCDDEKQKFKRALASTLRRCNPNGDLIEVDWRFQICDLVDLPSSIGWEAEDRLTQFAVLLAWMDGTPSAAYKSLKTWVSQRGFDFPKLLEKTIAEMKQQNVSSSTVCTHVMVEVNPNEQDEQSVWVSMWSISERETYDPLDPPLPRVQGKTVALQDLPVFIHGQLERLGGDPTVHVFVPLDLLGYSLDTCEIDEDGFILGSGYSLVMRMNLKLSPLIDRAYYDRWLRKWENLEKQWRSKASTVLKPIVDCSQPPIKLVKTLKPRDGAILSECSAIGKLFRLIAKRTALPIALWSRDSQLNAKVLDILDCTIQELPECIRQERESAEGEKGLLLGHHLSVVWEDPKVVPPTMQFDSEAC